MCDCEGALRDAKKSRHRKGHTTEQVARDATIKKQTNKVKIGETTTNNDAIEKANGRVSANYRTIHHGGNSPNAERIYK